MKAILLAAGYATRLYPLTLNRPKPLLKIAGKLMIEYSIDKISKIKEVDEIFIVTNNKFYSSFIEWSENCKTNKKITIVNDMTKSENERLGSIGDIKFVIDNKNIDDDLLILGGDNIFEDEIIDVHNLFNEKCSSCIAVNDVKNMEIAKLMGVVQINENSRIINFEEKPAMPKSTLIATLVYFLKREDLKVLEECIRMKKADRAGDFIKYLSEAKEVHACKFNKRWFDIGNHEQLKEADEFWRNKNK